MVTLKGKPLTGPRKYGQSKAEIKRAFKDMEFLLKILGSHSAALIASLIIGPGAAFIGDRINNLRKILTKKIKKGL